MRLARWTFRIRGLLVILAIAVAATNIFFYFFPQPPRWLEPDGALVLPEQGRFVIVAPHNDDEMLAAGGLIQVAKARGLDVRVVFLTNGDGFPLAAAQAAGRVRPGPIDFERLGELRQQESLAALAVVGVAAEQVSFLGFPDGGLPDLWQHHWAHGRPYRSRYTLRMEAHGQPDAVTGETMRVPYAGDAVVTELAQLFRQWQPQLVVMPHPADAHGDHWATYNFATFTLEQLRQSGETWVDGLEAWHYIVHRGGWPAPKGFKPRARLAPPPGLLTGHQLWQALPLDADTVSRKADAIMTYRSQVRVMRRYMISFARSNELFARLPPVPVPALDVPAGALPQTADMAVAMRQRFQDTVARRLEPAADITELRVAQSADGLWLYAGTPGRRGVGIRYRLMVRTIGADGYDAPAWSLDWSRQGLPQVTMLGDHDVSESSPRIVRLTDGWLIYVPADMLGEAAALMPGMQTYGPGGARISQTGWPLLILDPS